MDTEKLRFLILGALVGGLGIVIGTVLWLKLAPQPRFGTYDPSATGVTQRSYGKVPNFTFTERSGRSVSLTDLENKVWVADFIYTTCTDTCPLQSAEMTKLQQQFAGNDDIRLVSFSVDPTKDTPKVLSAYAKKFAADADRWLFLTGDRDAMVALVQGGFRLSADPVVDSSNKENIILHSPRFVLVDRSAEIRGYYDSRERDALERLKSDLAKVLKE